jgi:2'-5' RNA ligase
LTFPKVYGYYLWLLPDASSSDIFRNEIKRLSASFNSLPFEPHITISGVPDREPEILLELLNKIVINIGSFTISFNDAVYGEHPYQKITLPVKPTADYFSTCNIIDSVFEGNFSKKTFPHLSLLYGNQSKEIILEELNELKSATFLPAIIKHIALYKMDGLPDKWEQVSRIELN